MMIFFTQMLLFREEGFQTSAYLTYLSLRGGTEEGPAKNASATLLACSCEVICISQRTDQEYVPVKFPEVDSIIETVATSLARRRNAGYTRAADAIFVSMSSYLDRSVTENLSPGSTECEEKEQICE